MFRNRRVAVLRVHEILHLLPAVLGQRRGLVLDKVGVGLVGPLVLSVEAPNVVLFEHMGFVESVTIIAAVVG